MHQEPEKHPGNLTLNEVAALCRLLGAAGTHIVERRSPIYAVSWLRASLNLSQLTASLFQIRARLAVPQIRVFPTARNQLGMRAVLHHARRRALRYGRGWPPWKGGAPRSCTHGRA